MASEKQETSAQTTTQHAARSILRSMTPEMQREAASHLTKMLAIHVDILGAAAAKLKANAVDESSCQCTVAVINAICSCLGTGLGSILGDLGL